MNDINLPPLPDMGRSGWAPHETVHAMMRAYATAAVLAERERCALIVDEMVRVVDGADALHMIRTGGQL